MIRYVLKQITGDPPMLWTSPPFEAKEQGQVNRAVIAGALFGEPRWAETPEGTFLYGVDEKGKELKHAP